MHFFAAEQARLFARRVPEAEHNLNAVLLLQDFFLMSRAAGAVFSDPFGNPSLGMAANWNSGGHLPTFVAPPAGMIKDHQRLVQSTGHYPQLRNGINSTLVFFLDYIFTASMSS